MDSHVSPAATVAGSTLVALALGEHFVQLAAGATAYAVAWWLLREPAPATR